MTEGFPQREGEMKYVLVTPARNEESYIERTIQSVLSQTQLPERWVIVSDGSTDRTDSIVEKYRHEHSFISLLRAQRDGGPNFGSKVKAFQAGYRELANQKYSLIGNLDADVTFTPEYFKTMVSKFQNDPCLGIAGGVICELMDGKYSPQKISMNSVAGAVQLFRRECFEGIGGYIPIKSGGIDAAAEILARMHGWTVSTFPGIEVMHHRRVMTGSRNILQTRFKQGLTQYLLGYHPLFQLARFIFRISDKPFLIGSFFSLCGYAWGFLTRAERPMPVEAVKFLQCEQMRRLNLRFITNPASKE
jgi:poly-beta-1,6-N-acetyl-D-glucosamine synthase